VVIDAPPPTSVWTWPGQAPGFEFGRAELAWNVAQLLPQELAGIRRLAAGVGIVPGSVKPLSAIRLGPHDLSVLVAGADHSGRTCLGMGLAHQTTFTCSPKGAGYVVAAPRPRRSAYPLFLLGIARGDVTRVTVTQHEQRGNFTKQVYDRAGQTWGTFTLTLAGDRPWQATLAFYGERGLIARLPLRFSRPGTTLYTA
jgi:hypothetical protein